MANAHDRARDAELKRRRKETKQAAQVERNGWAHHQRGGEREHRVNNGNGNWVGCTGCHEDGGAVIWTGRWKECDLCHGTGQVWKPWRR